MVRAQRETARSGRDGGGRRARDERADLTVRGGGGGNLLELGRHLVRDPGGAFGERGNGERFALLLSLLVVRARARVGEDDASEHLRVAGGERECRVSAHR